MSDERPLLSLKDPAGWPEAFVGELPDEYAGRDRFAENMEERRAAEAAAWNEAVARLVTRPSDHP